MPRVLVVNPNHEDYLTDGVFHGLRVLLGANAVDYPKAEFLYDTITDGVLGRVRGGGFTLYGLLPDLPVDRDHLLPRALDGEFDLVVFGDIWRTFGTWTEWGPQLHAAGVPLAVLDGVDRVEPYPYRGSGGGRCWWFLPRAHHRAVCFKRELTPRRGGSPPTCCSRPLGRTLGLRPIAFSIPAEKIVPAAARQGQGLPPAHRRRGARRAPRRPDRTRLRETRRTTARTCSARASGSRPSAKAGTPCATTRSRQAARCPASATSSESPRRARRSGSTRATASPTATPTSYLRASSASTRRHTRGCRRGRSPGPRQHDGATRAAAARRLRRGGVAMTGEPEVTAASLTPVADDPYAVGEAGGRVIRGGSLRVAGRSRACSRERSARRWWCAISASPTTGAT